MKQSMCKVPFRLLCTVVDRMSSARMMVLLAIIGVGHGVAQHMSLQSSRDSECVELSQMVMAQVAHGRIAEAEKALSVALTGGAQRWADTCAAVVLGNMAAVVSYSGQLA
jgi:hypothetical protein